MMAEVKQEPKIVESSGAAGLEPGQLYVELGIPKVDDEGDPGGGDAENVTAEDLMVACGLCGKTFQSKKALSGHMRVHVRNQRARTKKECRELAAEVRLVSSTLLAEGKPPTCAVCCRTFPSMNSLYGHMRSHPDRRWRGVQPPVTDVKPELVIDFDLLTPVSAGWLVTGKRRRRSIASVNSGSILGSEGEDLSTPKKGLEEKDDISCFAMLSDGKFRSRRSPGEKIAVAGEADETEQCAMVGVKSDSIPERHPDDRDIKTEEAGSKNPHTVPDHQRLNKTIKRKVRELDDINRDHSTKRATTDVVGRVAAGKYTCKRCNKSFTSHQALGGHRSSCNKSKQSTGRAVVEETEPQSPSPRPQTELSEATAVGKVVKYHFPELFSRICSGNAERTRRMADFDLNELPTMEESEYEEEPKPNAKVGCGSDPSMCKPALVMGLSI